MANIQGNYSYENTPDMATPEQLKQRRALADYLMFGKGQQDVKSPWQGLSNMASMLSGGYLAKDSANSELDALRKAALSRGVVDSYDIRPPAQMQSEAEGPPGTPALAYNATEPRDMPGPHQTRGVVNGNLSNEDLVSVSAANSPPAPVKTASLGATPPTGPVVAPIAASSPQAMSTALRGGGGAAPMIPAPSMAPASKYAQGAPVNEVIPVRPNISKQQLIEALANPWIPEETKQKLQEMHLLQNQPQQMQGTGGTWVVHRDPRSGRITKQFVPEVKTFTFKGGKGEAQVPAVIQDGAVRPLPWVGDKPSTAAPQGLAPPPSLNSIEDGYR